MTAIVQVFSSGLISKCLMALGVVLLMRQMPTDQWAEYTFAFALVGIAAPMLSLLFNMLFIVGEKQRTRRDTSRFFAAQLWICLVLIVLGSLAWPWESGLLLAAAVLNLMLCLSEFAKTCYQQQLRFARWSLVELSRAALFLAGIGGLILWRGQQVAASEALYVQAATMLPLVLPLMLSVVDWRSLARPAAAMLVLRELVTTRYRYMTGYFVLLTILGQASILLVKALGTEAVLANFGAGFRYYGLLMLAFNAVLVVQLPAIKQAADTREVRHILDQHRRTIPGILAAIGGGALASPWLLPLVDGGKYTLAPYLLQILCVSVACSFVFGPHVNVVLRAGDYRYLFGGMLLLLPLSVVGCGLLLTRGGPYAMAWGIVATYVAWNLAVFLRSRKCLRREAMREEAMREHASEYPRLAA